MSLEFQSIIARRWRRMRRRRKVARAYDMALEIARTLPRRASILDVGCGNGFIAHHLTALLNAKVIGLDVGKHVDAAIDFAAYDGRHFPIRDGAFDAVILCYVLHHAQNPPLILNEISRVLRASGLAIIYEDIPRSLWDRALCWTHDMQWRGRSGPCRFRLGEDWKSVFESSGYELVNARSLSRWRNMAHPVARELYVLRINGTSTQPPERAGSAAAAFGLELCAESAG